MAVVRIDDNLFHYDFGVYHNDAKCVVTGGKWFPGRSREPPLIIEDLISPQLFLPVPPSV